MDKQKVTKKEFNPLEEKLVIFKNKKTNKKLESLEEKFVFYLIILLSAFFFIAAITVPIEKWAIYNSQAVDNELIKDKQDKLEAVIKSMDFDLKKLQGDFNTHTHRYSDGKVKINR